MARSSKGRSATTRDICKSNGGYRNIFMTQKIEVVLDAIALIPIPIKIPRCLTGALKDAFHDV
ncbi:hypothetical protein PanWU01x14_244040 [Parasponia andersonii]|uniref:Uncharacterized protein n=1 Tax=Parasponia andersonii TaxID=3476 RepID=A0A2P5BF75_PARAD|nr:hypothetical protein PanWU01x14_244040 [Parasponia andersonii]